MPADRQRAARASSGGDVRSRPFPREAYIFGWLAIGVVLAEGIYDLVTGVLGTGILFVCLVPVMVWLMHIRPRRRRDDG